MSTSFPPAPPTGGSPAPPPQSAAPPQEESKPCPICQGAGEIPASMGREEMLQALDMNTPNSANPEMGEAAHGQIPEINAAKPFTLPGREPLDAGQQQEVDRLGSRARNRMANGPKL